MNLNMKLITCAIFSVFTLSACQPQPMKVEQCWSDATKKLAGDLATQMMLDAIYDDWPAGKTPTDEEKLHIKNWIKIDLTGFYVRSADRDTGNFQCGASISAKYTYQDDVPESIDNVLEFSLVNGEKGQNIIENRITFANIVRDIDKAINAKKNSK